MTGNETPRSFAEQCEQVLVEVLAPVSAVAERIMQRLEGWLETGRPSRTITVGPGELARGEQLFTDLAQGMLTDELLGDAQTDHQVS